MSYFQVTFLKVDEATQELLVAVLTMNGYEGFEQTDDVLRAFIGAASFDENYIKEISAQYGAAYAVEFIGEQNWNQEWESNFSPVVMDSFAAIRAEFHQPIKDVRYELVITPKMSFGTGHHATTYLMIKEMSRIDFTGQTVLDFGTGTGVLAILARKMGASKVVAVDCDDWSIENAGENFIRNGCGDIELVKFDNAAVGGSYGIILANINRSIIIENLPVFAEKLIKKGQLLISGLLDEDVEIIGLKAAQAGFKLVNLGSQHHWNLMRFTH